MIKDRNEARAKFKEAGFDYDCITTENLKKLRNCINDKMIESGCMSDSFRCNKIWMRREPQGRKCAFLRGHSHYFKNREIVSFNPDEEFIGFAGWSDDTNIRPILDGFEQWLEWMKENAIPGWDIPA